jgi:hypothetical protein
MFPELEVGGEELGLPVAVEIDRPVDVPCFVDGRAAMRLG